jgi:formylglycine-generating enzyme required for sulfatase activity
MKKLIVLVVVVGAVLYLISQKSDKNMAAQGPMASAPIVTGSDGELLTNCIGMQFKRLPAGSFLMGAPDSEKDRRPNDCPQHKVTLTQPFYLGVYLVTQEQYEKVMGKNPSNFKGAKRPVETVNWSEAQDFCLKLSKLQMNMTYRLPTEAEWEYAARAGTQTAYYWGDNFDGQYAWCKENSKGESQEVGTRQPNAWGLYDMSGNAWEWCADWFGAYPASEQVDPKGAASGSNRVLRGGAWGAAPNACCSTYRLDSPVDNRNFVMGFRVVAVPGMGS